MIKTPLLWAATLLPGLFLYLINRQYRGILYGRRIEINSIMSRGKTFVKYLEAFRSSDNAKERTIDRVIDSLFYRRVGRDKYHLPLALNGIVAGLFVAMTFLWLGFHLGLSDAVEKAVQRVPREAIAGLAGAFIWGLYDIVKRYGAVDLTPMGLYLIWLRMLVAPIIAPLLSTPFTTSLKPAIAFGIGAFPIQELYNFIKGQTSTKLNSVGSRQPTEKPNLFMLQGLSEGMVDRLIDEGFESAAQVATADPIKLLLTTNIEWKTILDIIDQAILFGYFEEKIGMLRPFGIRGAIELATLQEGLDSEDSQNRDQAEKVISCLASKLGLEPAALRNAIRNAYEDVQVQFLWNLWGEIQTGEDDEDISGK